MGIAYRYLEDADAIVTVWDGLVTPEEWSAAVARQTESPKWLEGKRRLTDTRTADPKSISATDVETVATDYDRSDLNTTNAKLAIVANEGWSLAKLVESAMRKLGVTTVVFNDVYTACAWLGLDPDVASTALAEIRHELRSAPKQ